VKQVPHRLFIPKESFYPLVLPCTQETALLGAQIVAPSRAALPFIKKGGVFRLLYETQELLLAAYPSAA